MNDEYKPVCAHPDFICLVCLNKIEETYGKRIYDSIRKNALTEFKEELERNMPMEWTPIKNIDDRRCEGFNEARTQSLTAINDTFKELTKKEPIRSNHSIDANGSCNIGCC